MKYRASICLLSLFAVLAGCTRDRTEPTPGGGDSRVINITMTSANITDYTPDLRENETKMSDIEIFAFNAAGGTETFLYKVTPQTITVVDETTVRITAEIPYVTNIYNFAFLANAPAQVASLGEIAKGTSKEDILCELLHTENDWDGDFTIPMWGESGKVHIDKNTYSASFSVYMLRMVSRVDVLMSEDIDPGLFELATVELHGAHDMGYLVPAYSCWDADAKKVSVPTVPVTASVLPAPAVYTPDSDMAVTGIYTFERDRADAHDEVCFLLLGGYYDGDATMTWYRVDFLDDKDDPASYRHLLRNHLNLIGIMDVTGPGFVDKEDAIKSVPVNLKASVTQWDMSEDNLLIYGSHVLSVSANDIVTGNYASERIPVTVYTNYPDGWTAYVEDASGANTWLSIKSPSPVAGAAGEYVSLDLSTEANDTGRERSATIIITAGRLSYELRVTQTEYAGLELHVTDSGRNTVTELLFVSDSNNLEVDAQTINVDWLPTSLDCIVSSTDNGNPIIYASGSDDPGVSLTSLSGGSTTLTIKPQAFTAAEIEADPTISRESVVTFIVSNGSSYEIHTLVIRHLNYYLYVTPNPGIYEMGVEYVADVVCNGTWSLVNVDDPAGVVRYYTPNTTDNTFTFMLNTDKYDKLAVAHFVCNERPALTAQLPMRAHTTKGFANSYIVNTGGTVTIPTHNIAPFWRDYLGETISENFTIQQYYRDLNNGNLTNISFNNGIVTAKAPAEECNILLAAYIGTRIVWTWHIWVTKYDPDGAGTTYTYSPAAGVTYTFMDRNLGAKEYSWNPAIFMGYYYQWGRKNPLPPQRQLDQYDKSLIVECWLPTGSAQQSIPVKAVSSDHVTNIRNSITDPFSFITSSGVNDWYTSVEGDQFDYLWTDESGNKGIFDPCPEGWRVPPVISGYSPWQNIPVPTVDGTFFKWSVIGDYITTGYKNPADAKIAGDGELNLWTSTGSGGKAYAFHASSSGVLSHNYTGIGRGAAIPVRCVKDNF